MVSIYIISKDRKDYLIRAINSCLEQTYKNIEIIVIDDCSSSFDLDEISLNYRDEKIHFFRMEKPSGANVCRNKALSLAQGKYITGLDDDDYFTPNRIKLMVSNYQKYSKVISAVSTRHLFESSLNNNGVKNTIKKISTYFLKGTFIGLSSLLNRNQVGNHVLTETERLIVIGGFDENLPALQDYETWIRLTMKYGPVFRINKFLYIKNDSLPSITNSNRKKLQGFDYIIEKHKDFFSGREHCFRLHKLLYEQKYLNITQAVKLLRYGNILYILYLSITFRVRF